MTKQIPKQNFFDFFRQRLTNLKQVGDLLPKVSLRLQASFEPEFNVLLAAELDALAKYWSINQHPPLTRDAAFRWGEFLARNANPAWSKCSYLNMMERARTEALAAKQGHKPKPRELSNPKQQEAILDTVLGKVLPPDVRVPYAVIGWESDPTLSDLSAHREIIEAGISEEWLRRSRYGEILYRHHRCGWIHALDPGRELATDVVLKLGADYPPHYIDTNGTRKLAIPPEYILASLEQAITNFEKDIPDGASIMLEEQ